MTILSCHEANLGKTHRQNLGEILWQHWQKSRKIARARKSGPKWFKIQVAITLSFLEYPENQQVYYAFYPDGDPSNTYFWRERQMIRLEFAGIKGQADSP